MPIVLGVNTTKSYKLKRSKDYKRPIEPAMMILIGIILIVILSIISAFVWQALQEPDDVFSPSNKGVAVPQSYNDPRLIVTDSFIEVEATDEELAADPENFQSGIAYVQRELFLGSVPPKETPVDNSYFQTALFLGDAFTTGIPDNLRGVHVGFHVMGNRELTLSNPLEYGGFQNENKQPSTFLDLGKEPEAFKSVYIMIGQNDTGLSSEEFTEKYRSFVTEVRAIFPDATVYLQGLVPTLNPQFNSLAQERSLLIMAIAAESGSYFLDTTSVFSDGEGNMLPDATPDGNNITGEYYYRWFDYIKHHTV